MTFHLFLMFFMCFFSTFFFCRFWLILASISSVLFCDLLYVLAVVLLFWPLFLVFFCRVLLSFLTLFTCFFDVVLRSGKGARGGTDPQRGYAGGLLCLWYSWILGPRNVCRTLPGSAQSQEPLLDNFFQTKKCVKFFLVFIYVFKLFLFFYESAKNGMHTEKCKETQQTKKTEKTQKNEAKISYMFFSFQNVRFVFDGGIRGVASKTARQMHAKTTGKRADNNVQQNAKNTQKTDMFGVVWGVFLYTFLLIFFIFLSIFWRFVVLTSLGVAVIL